MARCIFGEGLPFTLVRSPLFKDMLTAVAKYGPAYAVPNYNTLRTTLLDAEDDRLQKELQPVKDSWPGTGCTIVSDGWSDAANHPLINKLAVSPGSAVFLGCDDTSGSTKSAAFIAADLEHYIKEVGPSNVVQVGGCGVMPCATACAL